MTRDGKSTIELENLAASKEVAELVGVSSSRVHQLLTEDPTFPRPIWHLKLGRIWDAQEIKAWTARNRVPLVRPSVGHQRRQPTTAPATPGVVQTSPEDRAAKVSALLGRVA